MELSLLLICAFTLAFCMVAKRLSNSLLTAPMIFITFGVLLAIADIAPQGEVEALLHIAAEIALIILLFLDASQIDMRALREEHVWSVRMLVFGLPLSVGIGTLAAWPFLQGWPLASVALVAAILAPTDAALGQAVVTNKSVPERERRALTVESGLNDGMALPLILLFASLTAATTQGASDENANWLLFGAMQIILGPIAGSAIGYAGGKILIYSQDREWTSAVFEGVAALALAGFAYLAAVSIGGNGFISAFTAGFTFGNVVKGRCRFIYEFTESEGQLLSWGAFFLLGLALAPEAIANLTPTMLAIIFISLFFVRPLAIWLSLIGTDASAQARMFFGWFGPRGLATALFALLVVSEIDHEYAEPVLYLAINAVWISALLHGITAVPGAKLYAKRLSVKGSQDKNSPTD